jgi:D-glycero-D-manno-heptose 1,7-bisphosphate phosphatase
MKHRAVFLDRDGVINRAIVREGRPYPPANISEVEILPDVDNALKELKDAGYLLIVVSNQPDVARGTTTKEKVEAINIFLANRLVIDRFIMCYHDSGEGCSCRKPRPGMLIDAANELDIDLSKSYMVGDRWRDVEAGIAAGCKTVFIDYKYDEKRPDFSDFQADSLREAATIILNNRSSL